MGVTLSLPADNLLKGYYLASRRARGSGFQGTPKTTMDTMYVTRLKSKFHACLIRHVLFHRISITLAHAKLSLRSEAIQEDAVLAIMLYEEGLLCRNGI